MKFERITMKLIIYSVVSFISLSLYSQNETFDLNQLYGSWRIDSTAENIFENRRNAVNEEFFVFDQANFLKMTAIEDGLLKTFTLGTYVVQNDSLLITTLGGSKNMKYRILLKDDFIQLDASFTISSTNNRKPTFFLGRKKIVLED